MKDQQPELQLPAARRLRVLHLIPSLAMGGAEHQLSLLSRVQARRGHDVHIAVLRRGERLADSGTGIALHQLAHAGSYDPRLIVRAAAVVRSVQPQIVQTWLTQMDVIGGIVARAYGIPWVLTERSCAAAYAGSFKARLRALLAHGTAGIVSNSRGGDAYWDGLPIRSQLRRVIPNGLDLAAVQQLAPAPDHLPDRSLILFGGRLAAEKNVDTLLGALGRVLRGADAMAMICGDGPDRARLEARARELHVNGRLVFTGHRPDLVALMKRAAVFVSVSRFEGHPNAVLEAMAAACPLVLSRIPAHTAFVDDDSAVFVDPVDTADIARGIEVVLRDQEGARRRAAVALAKAQTFSIEQTAIAYDELYQAVLAETSWNGSHRRARRTDRRRRTAP